MFDYSKHPSKPDPGGKCTPNLRLLGHRMEGYGMAWSPHRAGNLLSGSDDAQICLWDVNAANAGHELNALQIWSQHGGVVEVCVVVTNTRWSMAHSQDVAWHHFHEHMFGSVGDDRKLILWDTRKPDGMHVPRCCRTASTHPHSIHVDGGSWCRGQLPGL